MPYKLPAHSGASASATAGGANARSRGVSSPLAAALYNHLRAANMAQLERSVRACARQAAVEQNNPALAATLLLAAASGARALGLFADSQDYLARANAVLPPLAASLLPQIKREEVRLLLDNGHLRAALEQAAQLDCTVIERGKEDPLVERAGEASVETLILQAEVALCVNRLGDASALLDAAQKRLAESFTSRLRREDEVARRDQRDYLRLLEGVYRCRFDDTRGRHMLEVLEGRIEADEGANGVILAKCRAASGSWVEVDGHPPEGLNLPEARRWHSLGRPAGQRGGEILETDSSPVPAGVAHPPLPFMLSPQQLEPYAALLRASITSVAATVTATVTETLAAAFGPAVQLREGYLYGGKFPFIDLPSVVAQAEMQRETGFVQVNWNVAAVETTILAGRISPLARCGVGFIYVVDGAIVDATICTATPPPLESADERAALVALTCLLQIGIGIGLDHEPDGQAFCYRDDGVRRRHARIAAPQGANPSQNLMHALVVQRETELGIGPEGGDTLGEWEL
jgi:hypothetical protein